MKKLMLILACLMAVPAFALDVTLVDNANGTFDVTYDATGDAEQPRAFALQVTLTGGTIDTVTAAKTGESTAAAPGFGIFPGTIVIDASGNVTDYNTPVAPADDPGATGTGLGTASVILELGSLYVDVANAPATSGTLCTVAYTCPASGTIDVSVAAEATYRGGIVLEDTTVATGVTFTGLTGICGAPPECLKSTAPEYGKWVTYGKPDCWCFKKNCSGDVDGLKTFFKPVMASDLNIFTQAFNKTSAQVQAIVVAGIPGICADFDRIDTFFKPVMASDLNIFTTYFNQADSVVPFCDADADGVLDASDKYNFWTN